MTTAAESPGAEVQRHKRVGWWQKYGLPPAILFFAIPLAPMLVGIGVFVIIGVMEDTNLGYAKADLKVIKGNLDRYKTMTNKYPDSLEDFVRRPDNSKDNWRALMQKQWLIDPWGEPYQYRNPGTKNPGSYDLFSKGPDKTEGTDDDIGNWQ